jgi:hypothetical protein
LRRDPTGYAVSGTMEVVAVSLSSRGPLRFNACLIGALFCAQWSNFAVAVDVQAVGVGMISYRGSMPDAQDREKALELAKRDALENYVIDLRAKGAFPPDRYRLYLDHARQIEEALNQYVTDVVVVDEITDKATQRYQVRVRATINQSLFDGATSYSRLHHE